MVLSDHLGRSSSPLFLASLSDADTHGSCPGEGWAEDGFVLHGASPRPPSSARRRPAASRRPPPPRAGAAVGLRSDRWENTGALLKNLHVTFRIRNVGNYHTFNTFSNSYRRKIKRASGGPLRGAWWRPESRLSSDPKPRLQRDFAAEQDRYVMRPRVAVRYRDPDAGCIWSPSNRVDELITAEGHASFERAQNGSFVVESHHSIFFWSRACLILMPG